jgi:hypothetical protein
MLSVNMLNVVILSVVMLSVVMLSVVMLSVVMLSVVMLSVVMLSVVMLSIVTSVELLMTNFPTNYGTELMRGYQLQVSADRWQHWSQKCFATFIK